MVAPTDDLYTNATDSLRTTARWLIGVFAGIGGVVLASVSVSDIGKLDASDWPRILICVIALTAALITVGVTVRDIAAVLTERWIGLAQISDEHFAVLIAQRQNRKLSDAERYLLYVYDNVEASAQELYRHAAPSLGELHKRLREANEASERAHAMPPASATHEHKQWILRQQDLALVATRVTACANYHETRLRFQAARKTLFFAVLVIAVALVVFTFAAHTPGPDITKVHLV